MSIEKRIEKILHAIESKEFEHPGSRKAYYGQLFAEQKQLAEAAFKKLCNNLGLEPSAVRQKTHDTNDSISGVLSQYMGLEVQDFHRLLRERVNSQ
jgi:hypothetical protein